jgi:hypothetical protein
MLPITEQYVQSPCEVKTLSNDLIATGVVKVIQEDYMDIFNTDDVLPLIHCDTPVKINIFNEGFGFKVLVGSVFLSTRDFVRIINVQNMADFERRNFFRIRVNLYQSALLLGDDVNPDNCSESIKIHLLDLSLSGFYMTTKHHLEIGQKFLVNLSVSEDTNVACCCEVQREQSIGVNTNGYGCSFVDSSSRQMDLMCKYIFEKQREQIRIAKELRPGI